MLTMHFCNYFMVIRGILFEEKGNQLDLKDVALTTWVKIIISDFTPSVANEENTFKETFFPDQENEGPGV